MCASKNLQSMSEVTGSSNNGHGICCKPNYNQSICAPPSLNQNYDCSEFVQGYNTSSNL